MKDIVIFLPITVPALIFVLWWMRRDPSEAALIAEYEPPHGLSPAEAGLLLTGKADPKYITAELIGLAIDRHLRVTRISESDYLLEKLKYEDDLPNKFQKELIDNIFLGDTKPYFGERKPFEKVTENARTIKLSELKKVFRGADDFAFSLESCLRNKGYFLENPTRTKMTYGLMVSAIFGWLAYPIGFASGIWFEGSLSPILSMVASYVISISLIKAINLETYIGREDRHKILGLRKYIQVAEAERIRFNNAPALTVSHFEKLLPYAIAFGLEKVWAEKFGEIYSDKSEWYDGGMAGRIGGPSFIGSLDGFTTSFGSLHDAAPDIPAGMNSSPGGFSGGAGGFSGGGFGGGSVGGGGGGGGGGSW